MREKMAERRKIGMKVMDVGRMKVRTRWKIMENERGGKKEGAKEVKK